jgi:hypothetical protein
MLNSSLRLALASFLLVTTIGCKGKDDAKTDPAPAKTDPAAKTEPAEPAKTEPAPEAAKGVCSYITLDEAKAALGHPVKFRSEDPGSSNCILEKDGDPTPDDLMVDFTIDADGKGNYNYFKGIEHEEIADLGDVPAMYQKGNPGILFVMKGGKSLTVTLMQSKQGADVKPYAIALAKAILPRM